MDATFGGQPIPNGVQCRTEHVGHRGEPKLRPGEATDEEGEKREEGREKREEGREKKDVGTYTYTYTYSYSIYHRVCTGVYRICWCVCYV